MKRIKTALMLLSLWGLCIWLISDRVSAQEIFLQFMTPNGISIDALGNVNVHSDGVGTTLLTKFAPNGTQIIQVMLGNGSIDAERFLNSRLATDPLLDRLYLLSPEGDIVVFVSSTLQELGRFNIQAPGLTVHTSNVYDVAIAGLSNTFVLDDETTYGDIAVFRPNDGVNAPAWFVTGFSNGMAFVMRIPIEDIPDDVDQAEVILMSSTISPFGLERPRGVAIGGYDLGNGVQEPVGLTTLPVPGAIANCPDQVIRFSLTTPSLNSGNVVNLAGTSGVPSWGMGTNDRGFFLTTGGAGNAACLEGGSGRIVFITNTLTEIDTIIPLNDFPGGRPADVAVSPNPGGAIYLTVPNFGEVGRIPTSVLP